LAAATDGKNFPCHDVADVTALLGTTINEMRSGKLDAKIANANGYLASVLLRAREGGELEQQVIELRKQMEEVRRNSVHTAQATNGQARGGVEGPDRCGSSPSAGCAGGSDPLS
jgi:hypothetical protein